MAEDADTCAIRIELRAAFRPNRTVRGDAGQAAQLCRTKPLRIEPRPFALLALMTQSLGRLRGGGEVDGIPCLQIATDVQTLHQCDQLIDRLMAHLPNPPAGARTIPLRQLREF